MEKTFANTVVGIKLFPAALKSQILFGMEFLRKTVCSVFRKVRLHQTQTNAHIFVYRQQEHVRQETILLKHPVLAWTEPCRKDHSGRD